MKDFAAKLEVDIRNSVKATQFSEVLVQLKALGDKMNDLDRRTMKNLQAETEKGLVALAEAVEVATSAQVQKMLAFAVLRCPSSLRPRLVRGIHSSA